jgi:thiol-disulfide isomerase/thioredoxin
MAFALAAPTTLLTAQEMQPPGVGKPPAVKFSPAEKAFADRLSRTEEYLNEHAPYEVTIESTWKSTGAGHERAGKNVFRLVVGRNRDHFRIEAGRGGEKGPGLVVVSDGKTVTHLYSPKKLYTRRTTDDPFTELQRDALTVNALEGSGIDFLVRKNIRRNFLAQTAAVQDLGDVKLDGEAARHFRLTLANRRQKDVWFAESDAPLFRQATTTLDIPVKGQEVYKLTITSRLQWNVDAKLPEDDFTVKLPDGARKVRNLLDALVRGDAEDLLGKPAPKLRLTALDSKDLDPSVPTGKQVEILYLWATWCAPSVGDMPGLTKFIRDYEKKGVTFLAVNVGEKPDVVKACVAKHSYKGVVALDPESASLEAYRLSALPAAILIGRDGTVQAIHTGAGPGMREQIGRDLDALLQGKTLAPPAARK